MSFQVGDYLRNKYDKQVFIILEIHRYMPNSYRINIIKDSNGEDYVDPHQSIWITVHSGHHLVLTDLEKALL
jgi:hypothetical protein